MIQKIALGSINRLSSVRTGFYFCTLLKLKSMFLTLRADEAPQLLEHFLSRQGEHVPNSRFFLNLPPQKWLAHELLKTCVMIYKFTILYFIYLASNSRSKDSLFEELWARNYQSLFSSIVKRRASESAHKEVGWDSQHKI